MEREGAVIAVGGEVWSIGKLEFAHFLQ